MLQADFDNDGWTDVLVLRGGWMGREARFPPSLLRNDGDGTFTDVTEKAGLMRAGPTQTAAFLDYDGDGGLDLYVGYESEPANVHPCALYRNNGDGTFTDVAAQVGVDAIGFVKAVVSADYDRDGRPDLFLSVAAGDNVLFHNDGPQADGRFRFTNVAAAAGVPEPQNSFPAAFFDYDNDGWPDLFVAGVRRHGGGRGRRPARPPHGRGPRAPLPQPRRRHLRGRDARGRPLPGDGGHGPELRRPRRRRLPRPLHRHRQPRPQHARAEPACSATTPAGASRTSRPRSTPATCRRATPSRSATSTTTATRTCSRRWAAPSSPTARAARSTGTPATRTRSSAWSSRACARTAALSARASRSTVDTDAGPRTFHRTVGSGGSFGASPLRLEIGLGAARRIRAVEIVWPGSGLRQAVDGLSPGRRYRVREGEPAREVKRVPIRLAAE